MPPPRFSVRDLEQIQELTGYTFEVTTDVPCHLYMRWTVEKPRTHKDPVFKRGALFSEEVRFCFVEYEDNEQEEAGDTLIHTFIKHDWPICQTRHFYFWGMVAGESSPSESPLFQKHFELKGWVRLTQEPWTRLYLPKPEFELYFLEPWGVIIPYTLITREEWTRLPPGPPEYEHYFIEEWTS